MMNDIIRELSNYGDYYNEPDEAKSYEAKNGILLPIQDYEPDILVEDITKLTTEEWLDFRRGEAGQYRRGGSGAANTDPDIMSSFATPREEYCKQKGITQEDVNEIWALERGHIMEPLGRKYLKREFQNAQLFELNKMFQHPYYKWLIADCDGFMTIPQKDGSTETVIVEIKSTNQNTAEKKWGLNDFTGTIPACYVEQARQYMAVTGLNRVIFCCMYGPGENDFLVRTIKRDLEREAHLIEQTANFVLHLEKDIEPPFVSLGSRLQKEVRNTTPSSEPTVVEFDASDELYDMNGNTEVVDDLVEKLYACDKDIKKLEEQLKAKIDAKKEEKAELEAIIDFNTKCNPFILKGRKRNYVCEIKKTSIRENVPINTIRTEYPDYYDFFKKQGIINISGGKEKLNRYFKKAQDKT